MTPTPTEGATPGQASGEQFAQRAGRVSNEHRDLGEFYAGWNAAIRTLREVAAAQGWWMPDSADGLMVKRP